MWRIRDAESIQTLIKSVRLTPPALRYFVVKALNKLHRAVPGLRFDSRSVYALILAETDDFDHNRRFWLALAQKGCSPRQELLLRALRERCALSLELIFRLLGLVHPSPDMLSAYLGIVGDKPSLLSSAAEFLDNYLQGELRWRILLVIEQWTEIRKLKGEGVPSLANPTIETILMELLRREDPWLQALALTNLAVSSPARIGENAGQFAGHPDPFLRETAACLQATNPSGGI